MYTFDGHISLIPLRKLSHGRAKHSQDLLFNCSKICHLYAFCPWDNRYVIFFITKKLDMAGRNTTFSFSDTFKDRINELEAQVGEFVYLKVHAFMLFNL